MNTQKELLRLKKWLYNISQDKRNLYILIPFVLIVIIYTYGKYADNKVKVFHKTSEISFSGGRILGDNGKDIYKRKGQVFSKRIKTFEKKVKSLDHKFDRVTESLENIKKSLEKQEEVPRKEEKNSSIKNKEDENVSFSPPPDNHKASKLGSHKVNGMKILGSATSRRNFKKVQGGPNIVAFPIQSKKKRVEMGVKLPAGAFVKAKLLTGIEAGPKPLPVLLQADHAFIGPNKSRIDLTGCFLIAKSSGNLSIERVEMQATKISCVAKSGRMFDTKINGFIADAKDNSFAVMGKVSSKQDRVAAMAFLSSVVDGVGKAIQESQTTTQSNSLGGLSSVISGDKAKYMAAGGASNAASQVTQWYLKHAQNLSPSIAIGSGQDVWIVIQDTVNLPNWYFKKEKKKSTHGFSYLSRFLDN